MQEQVDGSQGSRSLVPKAVSFMFYCIFLNPYLPSLQKKSKTKKWKTGLLMTFSQFRQFRLGAFDFANNCVKCYFLPFVGWGWGVAASLRTKLWLGVLGLPAAPPLPKSLFDSCLWHSLLPVSLWAHPDSPSKWSWSPRTDLLSLWLSPSLPKPYF